MDLTLCCLLLIHCRIFEPKQPQYSEQYPDKITFNYYILNLANVPLIVKQQHPKNLPHKDFSNITQ